MADKTDLENSLDRKNRRSIAIILLLVIVLGATYFLCLLRGSASYSAAEMIRSMTGGGTWGSRYILYNIRMPREICAAVVGAGLAVAGMAMQAMFRNPMASPSVLGLSSGASFGASLSIAFGLGGIFGSYATPAMAFIFCFITMALVYGLSVTRFGTPAVLLLLSGVAVGALFSGLTSFIQYIVEPDVLQGVVYWTMGSFSRCQWNEVWICLPIVTAGVLMITCCHKELNLISLGEEQAEALGVNIRRTRILLLIGTSLCVGGSVAVAGVIGFVGLMIPHVCRALCGPNHNRLIPMCILVGAIFLLIMDTLAKSVLDANEMPVGILTSLLGAPFFIYIMRKRRNELWG